MLNFSTARGPLQPHFLARTAFLLTFLASTAVPSMFSQTGGIPGVSGSTAASAQQGQTSSDPSLQPVQSPLLAPAPVIIRNSPTSGPDNPATGGSGNDSSYSDAQDLCDPQNQNEGQNLPDQPNPCDNPNLDRNRKPVSRSAQNLKTQQNRTVMRAEPLSEFQTFVLNTNGKRLPLFGYDLFRQGPTTFAPLDQVAATSDYVVGPGDQLLIRAWGQIDIDYRATVDRTGNIYIPRVGNIRVAGLKYEQLQPYLNSQIRRVFNNFDLNVTLGQLRSIEVFVVGLAHAPGRYTVSSLSTLLNALFASGGPSRSGSMRRIQLKRGTRLVTEFDLYDMLLNGDKSKDVPLLPGDVIFIPPVGEQVAVSGSVQVPAIYELKGRLNTLGEVLKLAGGLTPVASGDKARVERVSNREVRTFEVLDLDPAGLANPVHDGDLINIKPLNARYQNAVTLRGNVTNPGRYPWHPGMRIRDLIPSREALITAEYYLKQSQATTAPGLTRRVVPDINWDYAVIQRQTPEDLSSNLIPFNLGKAIRDGDAANNVELQPGDVVSIFSQSDLLIPRLRQNAFVQLAGEINSAGAYRARFGETLQQLIARAGGVTSQAYLFGSVFTRESTRIEQQKQLDEFINREEETLHRSTIASANKAGTTEEASGVTQRAEAQNALLTRLRRIRPTGRIVMGLRPTQKDVRNLPDITLEDGDQLVIPSTPATIGVIGEVYNPGSFLWRPGRRAASVLRQAGGPTRNADRSHEFVIRADGSVVGKARNSGVFSSSFDSIVLMPGDTVVVPDRFDRGDFLRSLKDYSQIFGQLALGIASIRVIGK